MIRNTLYICFILGKIRFPLTRLLKVENFFHLWEINSLKVQTMMKDKKDIN